MTSACANQLYEFSTNLHRALCRVYWAEMSWRRPVSSSDLLTLFASRQNAYWWFGDCRSATNSLRQIHIGPGPRWRRRKLAAWGSDEMGRFATIMAAGLAGLLLVAGCAGQRGGGRPSGPNPREVSDQELNIRLMLSYDANSDGTVTRDELEAGLKRQFAAADTNGDGRLDPQEVRAENDRRFMASGTATSPLIDWNQDGFVSFDEFASTARSVFETVDRNHDGKLTPDELRLPATGRGAGGPPGGRGGGGRGGGGGGRRGG
jgi:Ca2+-binding EF-hand superfamily protein